ncbi:MAG: hypothetical protein JRI55_33515, partial [Deltaproteobacteria bacterium]|nr:hypothetical protein [Deltaproteobacteria bacterium]
MKVTLSRTAWFMIAAVALMGCPKEDETDDETTPPATSTPQATTAAQNTTAAPTAQPTTDLTPEAPGAAGVEARAKAELDGKDPDPDHKGTNLVVTGTKTTFVIPSAWKTTKSGAWHTSVAADDKSRFAAGTYASGDDVNAKLNEAAGAVGLTDCKWSSGESASIGKDKLAATVYDGVCKRSGNEAKTAAVTLSGTQNTIAVGGWDNVGGDSKTVFNIFKSVKTATGGGDPTGIAACCAALQQNA